MNWDHETLILLGLSEFEITILQCLKTPKQLKEISEETCLVRTSVAYNLKGLIKRKIVHQIKFGKRYRYIALLPHQFSLKLQDAIDEVFARQDEQKGVRIKTNKENEFIIHIGPREIVPAFKRIALEIKNDRVKAIQHHRSFNDQVEVATPKQVVDFNQAIIQNKIIVDGILNEGAYKAYYEEIKGNPEKFKAQIKSLEGRMSDYSTFPDNYFNYDAEIWIFKTTTLIINWKEKVAIEITNESMTNFLREMFEYVKRSSKKIDHNEVMRGLLGRV